MKQKLLRSADASFVLIFVLMFVGMNICYSYFVESRDNWYLVTEQFLQSDVDPEILILGDSHPAMDIRHSMFHGAVFNWAHPAENIQDMLFKERVALRTKSNIATIIIPYDTHIFSAFRSFDRDFSMQISVGTLEELQQSYHNNYLQFGINTLVHYLPLLTEYNRIELQKITKKAVESLFTRRPITKSVGVNSSAEIFYNEARMWNDQKEKIRKVEAGQQAQQWYQDPVAQEFVDALENFFAIAHSFDIQVIGVRFPLSKEMQKTTSTFNLLEVEERLSGLPFDYVLDYRSFYDNQPELFHDAHHLTQTGAVIFTEQLRADLQSAGVIK